ncbi:N-acyl-D-amino-acid deacylase family protein [Alicycliphilus denitrificans]|uniref:D-aminoacylase n=1 Tax=Alicycliphilus denitrificans TaxID=179636 RepID=A0A3R7HMH3_9BURK|nr:amidohydrolase family protein [Alicycliphilus denitrificans]RKJ95146.1 D-aminoacylase [Alicycliphilus denitrificans]
MTHAFDLVIRSGTVVDGSGGPPRQADIAIAHGKIARVGQVPEKGREEIDATGKLVTPGFVDIHTHYDGQVTWENTLKPSSNHGVTTVITGNCGVGFAPCKPEQRDTLVRVMEGVEDVPEIVMTEGLPWNWETFPEYLDSLQDREYDIDFAAQIPHSAVRVYVMGERGERREPATAQELRQMTDIVREAIQAGAVGVSSSHHLGHRTVAGELAPSVGSASEEVLALARGLREAGGGVFQMITDGYYGGSDASAQMDLLRGIAQAAGRPVSYSLLQKAPYLRLHEDMLALMRQARAQGLDIKAQVFPRPVGLLFGLTLSFHPFRFHPSYQAIHGLPLAQRVAEMRRPEVRAAILSEKPEHPNPIFINIVSGYDNAFSLGDPPNYEPPPEALLHARAKARGVSVAELAYDLLLENDGNAVLMSPSSNFAEGNFDAIEQMLLDENTLIALGDGGAHYGMICDSSYPTTVLTHWVRDRQGRRMPLEQAVHRLSRKNALAVGLADRGLIAEGLKADINVIDLDRLRLHPPQPVYDLPVGGRRLMQKSEGYAATIVSGRVTYRDGVPTGARPGRLVRNRSTA